MSGPLLLDTHVWLWAVQGVGDRLAREVIPRIDAVGDAGRLLVSAISLWEVAMLESRHRITLGQPIEEWIDRTIARSRVQVVPLEPAITIDSTRLPGSPHGDPADLILMASARVTDATLVTCDSRILRYAAGGHLRVLDARP